MWCIGNFTLCYPDEKVQNLLPFRKCYQKLANSDVTKEALDCIVSLQQLTVVDAIKL